MTDESRIEKSDSEASGTIAATWFSRIGSIARTGTLPDTTAHPVCQSPRKTFSTPPIVVIYAPAFLNEDSTIRRQTVLASRQSPPNTRHPAW